MTKETLLRITICLMCCQYIAHMIGSVVGSNVAAMILRALELAFGLAAIVTLYASTKK